MLSAQNTLELKRQILSLYTFLTINLVLCCHGDQQSWNTNFSEAVGLYIITTRGSEGFLTPSLMSQDLEAPVSCGQSSSGNGRGVCMGVCECVYEVFQLYVRGWVAGGSSMENAESTYY